MKTFLTVSTLAVAAFAASPSFAVTQLRVFATNPTGICQSALPVFDGMIRKRPKAVANEGTSNAFITCSFPSQGPDGPIIDPANPRILQVYFSSLSGSPQDITCTAVAGWEAYTEAPAVPKTVTADASQEFSNLIWEPADFGEEFVDTLPTALISISCKLPPSTAIHDAYLYFTEDVGT